MILGTQQGISLLGSLPGTLFRLACNCAGRENSDASGRRKKRREGGRPWLRFAMAPRQWALALPRLPLGRQIFQALYALLI